VLHGDDLTYSIASGTHAAELPDTIRGSFFAISRGFIEGLRRLGVEADVVRAASKETERSPLCFMSASWYEITCRGRKIIGSAQRRWKDGMLQQGTLLLGFNPETHNKYFRPPNGIGRKQTVQESPNRIFGLHDLVPERMTPQMIAKQIAAGFETSLGIRLKPDQLTPVEHQQADFLARTKYSTHSWNSDQFHRSTP
jgi:lipoate-protein ligase A